MSVRKNVVTLATARKRQLLRRAACGLAAPPSCGRASAARRRYCAAVPPHQLRMMAAAAAVATSLLALLAADGTAVLDCVCATITIATGGRPPRDALFWGNLSETIVWNFYCDLGQKYQLVERCETTELPSVAALVVSMLVPWDWGLAQQPPQDGFFSWPAGEAAAEARRQCSAALAAIHDLPFDELIQLPCHLMEQCIQACPAQGLNDTMWDVQTLTDDNLRVSTVFRITHAVRRISRVLYGRLRCVDNQEFNTLFMGANITGREMETRFETQQKRFSKYWRDAARLLSVGVKHLSHLLIPNAFEYMDNHTNDQQLHRWIKNTEHVRDMLGTKFLGWLQDMQSAFKQVANYKIEEDESSPMGYIIRQLESELDGPQAVTSLARLRRVLSTLSRYKASQRVSVTSHL